MTRRTLTHSKTYPLSDMRHWYGDPINPRPHFAAALAMSRTPPRNRFARSTRGRLWDVALANRNGGTTTIATDPRTCASFGFFAEREYRRWETDNLRPTLATLIAALDHDTEGTP